MNINAGNMEKHEMNLPYEQPSLKKYGTMKEFTLGASGSGGDAGGMMQNPGNTIQDPDVPGNISDLANDSILSFGNDNDDLATAVDGNQD